MDRLERALAVVAPPGLAGAARAAGCPAAGIRELVRSGRIVELEPDLAYAASTYGELAERALAMAALTPLTPAAFRDATGTSRKYVMAILADLDRRGDPAPDTGRSRPGPAGARDGCGGRMSEPQMSEPKVTGLVLAGGRSSRFGRDKLAEPIDGRPLLWHAIDAVQPLCDEVLVVAAPDSEPILPPGVRVVRDRVAFEGPLTGLLAGLLEARAPLVIVVGGDMPSLVGEVLAAMLAELDTHGRVDAVVLQHAGQARPLPMALRREPALIVTASLLDAGARRLRAVTEALDRRVIKSKAWRALDPDGRTLVDIDEPSDLA